MFRIVHLVILTSCALGEPRVRRSVPEAGAIEVPATSPVVLTFDRRIDASDASVRWTHFGVNGLVPASFESEGRTLTITPIEPAPWGLLQDVVVDGVRDQSGTPIEAGVRFRTQLNPQTAWLDRRDGVYDQGWRCEVDELVRVTRCRNFDDDLGEDGIPASDDDPWSLQTDISYGGDGYEPQTHEYSFMFQDRFARDTVRWSERGYVASIMRISASYDEQIDTADDAYDTGYIRTFDERGFLSEQRTVVRLGDDERFGTRDDVFDAEATLHFVDERGGDLGWARIDLYAPPPSGPGGAAVWQLAVLHELDPLGRRIATRIWEEGEDESILTADDVLVETTLFSFDEDGRRRAEVQVDADGEVVQSWATLRDEAGQVLERWLMQGDSAEDDVLDPDLVYGIERWTYDTEGRRQTHIDYDRPGPDGVWFTDDDQIDFEETFAPGQGGE